MADGWGVLDHWLLIAADFIANDLGHWLLRNLASNALWGDEEG